AMGYNPLSALPVRPDRHPDYPDPHPLQIKWCLPAGALQAWCFLNSSSWRLFYYDFSCKKCFVCLLDLQHVDARRQAAYIHSGLSLFQYTLFNHLAKHVDHVVITVVDSRSCVDMNDTCSDRVRVYRYVL